MINPANKMVSYVYDNVGQRRFLTDPAGGRFSPVYDAYGRIKSLYRVDPVGNQVGAHPEAKGETEIPSRTSNPGERG